MFEEDSRSKQEARGSPTARDQDGPGRFDVTAVSGRRAPRSRTDILRLVLAVLGVVALGLSAYALWLALQPTPDPMADFRATSISLLTATLAPYSPQPSTSTPTIEPTRTLTPTVAPTRTPTPTRTRRPNSPKPTPKPTSPRSTPTPYPAPTLLEPGDGATPPDRIVFRWQWEGPPLKENEAFDLRIWSVVEEQRGSPRRGAVPPTKDTQAEVNLPYVPAVLDLGAGEYYWTVVVVKVTSDGSPRVIGEWGEKRRFVFR